MQRIIDIILEDKSKRKYFHIGYWLFVVLFFGFFWGTDYGEFGKFYFSEVVLLPVKMGVVYLFLYFLIPRFLFKKKYFLFLSLGILSLAAGGVLLRTLNFLVVFPLFPPPVIYPFLNIYEIMHRIVDINTLLIIPAAGKILVTWNENKNRTIILEKEKMEAELRYLRSRVNPHFLFNSLNNIYSLVQKKSESAGDMILKLSGLMRYMLRQTESDYIPMSKEIEFISSYIELEKIRFSEGTKINFEVTGDLAGKYIAPLILLPFVENCFKHVLPGNVKNSYIVIAIVISDKELVLRTKNSFNTQNLKKAAGFGIKNVKKRLDILYNRMYYLEINKGKEDYSVNLKLEHNNG